MPSKPLIELLREAEEEVVMAEFHYSNFPSVLSSIQLNDAIEKSEKLTAFYESIMIDLVEIKPKKKRKRTQLTPAK